MEGREREGGREREREREREKERERDIHADKPGSAPAFPARLVLDRHAADAGAGRASDTVVASTHAVYDIDSSESIGEQMTPSSRRFRAEGGLHILMCRRCPRSSKSASLSNT